MIQESALFALLPMAQTFAVEPSSLVARVEHFARIVPKGKQFAILVSKENTFLNSYQERKQLVQGVSTQQAKPLFCALYKEYLFTFVRLALDSLLVLRCARTKRENFAMLMFGESISPHSCRKRELRYACAKIQHVNNSQRSNPVPLFSSYLPLLQV